MKRKSVWGLVALVVALALLGIWESGSDDKPPARKENNIGGIARSFKSANGAGVHFERWTHPQRLFSAEVPRGWRVEGNIDPQGLDKGSFMIRGFSPDGRSMFVFAHNWQWFMEYQYGRYRPGNATLETLVVPDLPKNLPEMGLRAVRVSYASPNKRFQVPNPTTGMMIVGDQGKLGLMAVNARGEAMAGTLLGETMYIPMPGTPGLWSLRIFSGGLAPATPADQEANLAIQKRIFESLELSAEFMQQWRSAHDRSVQLMRDYSRDMDRVMKGFLESARARSGPSGKSPEEKWSEMMRGGHYERDDRTGDRHWVGNDHRYWFKNDRGILVGNNTGQPPSNHDNWHRMRP